MKNLKKYSIMVIVFTVLLFFLVFTVLFKYDNKYSAVQAIGSDGILKLDENDLKKPVFLIDGWMLSIEGRPETETFIGQYSNFSYAPGGTSPFGKATYRLSIEFSGEPKIVALEIPEIFTEYSLYINGKLCAERGSGNITAFILDGKTDLLFKVENSKHYYSGLYYPPTLGTSNVISRICFVQTIFYSILVISSATLSLFSLTVWLKEKKGSIFYHFGFLCLAFSISCIHSFLWRAGLTSPIWYAFEDSARFIVWVEALAVSTQASGLWKKYDLQRIYDILIALAAVCFITVGFIIPVNPSIIEPYGYITGIFVLLCWFSLAISTGVGLTSDKKIGSLFSMAGCCALGSSIVSKILDNDAYEPIYTGWQEEWAGFFLVCVFCSFIVWFNTRIIEENTKLTTNLEETVSKRTTQLEAMIEERKTFFSDMAHNLKAPIAAIHGFISLIRDSGIGVDDELLGYLALIESENLEMRKRVQALNTLNAFDKVTAPSVKISVNSILQSVEDNNSPEIEAAGIFFVVEKLKNDVFVKVQEEKILMLFENLIYNSLSFTPMNGTISIYAYTKKSNVIIEFSDTGCGISPDNLPHIFDRFFVARENKNEGSGLGLYIAKLTMEEAEGSIKAESSLGNGTKFILTFPSDEN